MFPPCAQLDVPLCIYLYIKTTTNLKLHFIYSTVKEKSSVFQLLFLLLQWRGGEGGSAQLGEVSSFLKAFFFGEIIQQVYYLGLSSCYH